MKAHWSLQGQRVLARSRCPEVLPLAAAFEVPVGQPQPVLRVCPLPCCLPQLQHQQLQAAARGNHGPLGETSSGAGSAGKPWRP
jgi:hypothetical protein